MVDVKTDLLGKKFGKLLVVEFIGPRRTSNRKTYNTWKCLCDCGAEKILERRSLTSIGTLSCGCTRGADGVTKHPLYPTYKTMRSRCCNKSHRGYLDYGGRGIMVCDRWLEPNGAGFRNFLEDMGEKPSEKHSIDRIDVNGNYCKENCRWALPSLQSFNSRKRCTNTSGRTGLKWKKSRQAWEVYIRIDGKETYIGSSKSFEEAVRLREAAEMKYYGFIKE